MRAWSLLLLVCAAAMLAGGCGKTETVPPMENADMTSMPIGKGPVAQPNPLPPPQGIDDSSIFPVPSTYTVKAGDTLYSLAKRFYGDGKLKTKILEANKDKIKDENVIKTGTVLKIPPK
jgi:nucleoid-associated protein YgaU